MSHKLLECLAKRLHWWIYGSPRAPADLNMEEVAAVVQQRCQEASRVLPLHVVASYLRVVANAWLTTYRLSGCGRQCPFCWNEVDRFPHLLNCTVIQEAIVPFFHASFKGWPLKMCTPQVLCIDEVDNQEHHTRMIWHDVLYNVYNSKRHGRGNVNTASLIRARIRMLCRKHPYIKSLLVKQRRGTMGT